MKSPRYVSLVLVVCCLVVLPAVAAEPESGEISKQGDEATWNGGPFYISNPSTNLGLVKTGPCDVGEPACDQYRLTVSSKGIKQILIAIAPDPGYEADDYDLHVYDDTGTRIAESASDGGNESVVIQNATSAYYDIRVQAWLVAAGSSYSGIAQATRNQAVDVVTECLELVPDTIALPVVDSGQRVELSVMMLLDGTDAAVAEQLINKAAASYKPLNIDLVLKKTKSVSFDTTISSEIITAGKNEVGGKPPKGIDIVGVFTNKSMQSATGGAGTVVGQADCIGGIRWDETSFFVASDIRHIEDPQTGTTGTLNSMGLNPNMDAAAEVIAHEIGHLMGAHHHYANCVEGMLTSAGPNDVSPCTLMFPAVNFASLNFAALEGAVVRGHAVDYATP
ncbi:MAG TPA: zinc-dependent metalloprotease family protein [Rhodothermales bacterium]|nr:zinc-dependent metalloprotease family protein [Rhodothermales bacterium]